MTKIKFKESFFVLFLLISLSLIGCTKTSQRKSVEDKRKNIVLAELNNTRPKSLGLTEIQSTELFSFTEKPVYSIKAVAEESIKSGIDNSQISTMFDGFGNKTEVRSLKDDPILRCVVSKTFADGRKQVLVYGKSGEVKILQGELLDKAMSVSSSLIAGAVGLFKPDFAQRLPQIEPLMSTEDEPSGSEYSVGNLAVPTTTENGLLGETKSLSSNQEVIATEKNSIGETVKTDKPAAEPSQLKSAVRELSPSEAVRFQLYLNRHRLKSQTGKVHRTPDTDN